MTDKHIIRQTTIHEWGNQSVVRAWWSDGSITDVTVTFESVLGGNTRTIVSEPREIRPKPFTGKIDRVWVNGELREPTEPEPPSNTEGGLV